MKYVRFFLLIAVLFAVVALWLTESAIIAIAGKPKFILGSQPIGAMDSSTGRFAASVEAGNVGLSSSVTVTVSNLSDATPPTITITSPVNGSVLPARKTEPTTT